MFARMSAAQILFPTFLTLLVAAALVLAAGCGGESSKPAPELAVMGAIHLVRAESAAGPYEAGVVVSVDGQVITNATVRINGTPLVYNSDPAHPERAGYAGLISVAEGQTAQLQVSCSAGEKTLQAVVPGFANISAPALGASFPDDQDVDVSWTPASHAVLCIVACAGASTAKPGTWVLLGNATTQTVSAAYTAVPGSRISVISLSGLGDLPSEDLRTWVGKTGFWATSQESVDIQVVE